MTPSGAVDGIYIFYRDTVKGLDESGWDPVPADGNVDGQIPEGCRLTDGSPGVKYSILLGGPGQASPLDAARRVQSIWSALGYEAEVKLPENPHDPQISTAAIDPTINAKFTVDTGHSWLSLVSGCVPGDESALSERVVEQREHKAPASSGAP